MNQMVLGNEAIGSGDDLDKLLAGRLAQLEASARRVLEVVAVSGGPLPQSLLLELEGESSEEQVVTLCDLGLLVRSEAGVNQAIETAHDRIREMCLAGLTDEQQRALHWAIGERLLARCGPDPAGDEVFAIADHFDAGLAQVDVLAPEQRLELAGLLARAGERALGSAAWTSARRYLGLGHRLVEPWLGEARRGEGPRQLCLTLAFGRAQVEVMAKSEVGNAAFDGLMEWSLSDSEIGQIVVRRMVLLGRVGRTSDSIDVGLEGLARLGLKIPRVPSTMRALVALMVGWLTLGKRSLESLRALQEIRDERARVQVEVLVELTASANIACPLLSILATGIAARTIHRHGRHAQTGRVILGLAAILNGLGKASESASMYDRAADLAKDGRPSDSLWSRALALLVLPASRPIRGLLGDIDALHRECWDYGMPDAADYVAVYGTMLWLPLDMPHSTWEAMLDQMEARGRGLSLITTRIMESVRGCVHGFEQAPPLEYGGDVAIQYTDFFCRLQAAVERCDYARANSLEGEIPADFERVVRSTLSVPLLALCRTIVEAQHWSSASGRERRRALRKMRRCAKTTRRWAAQCPENFGSIADIVSGEIAAVRGHFDQAMTAYERAHATARENRMLRIGALAYMRLARLAHRRGHTIMAESASESAIAIYETWGAKALVARLREIGIDAI